jgi:hypothetical protein
MKLTLRSHYVGCSLLAMALLGVVACSSSSDETGAIAKVEKKETPGSTTAGGQAPTDKGPSATTRRAEETPSSSSSGPAAPSGTGTPPPSSNPKPETPDADAGGKKVTLKDCETTKTFAECKTCINAVFPGAAKAEEALDKAIFACACTAPGACKQQCAKSICANNSGIDEKTCRNCENTEPTAKCEEDASNVKFSDVEWQQAVKNGTRICNNKDYI